ncbi:Sodium/calcium exchanger protein-domain-containing protein [Bombardia bombarda]|uniref:Sodium/calcium exchanger protein-domain-containing protein n=1 Tax=Bombardia bombarda TaxID=252184 RepID=A0AA39WZR8_9PEZI|nr:Sodium/calcium exchanger protein-domain-containing protein [Bombardia bombarda]
MKETSPNLNYTDRIRSWAKSKAHGGSHRSSRRSEPDLLPISSPHTISSTHSHSHSHHITSASAHNANANVVLATSSSHHSDGNGSNGNNNDEKGDGDGGGSNDNHRSNNHQQLSPATSPQTPGQGPVVDPGSEKDDGPGSKKPVVPIATRFLMTFKQIMLYSKLNLLLIFVPIGIAVQEIPGMPPGVIFAMNALAIVPLAGLLSYATESVARNLGDSLGALLNVTFGNAVELIIFIALVKNEIRIVQASLLGSILANLLLILGMSFLLGGLRFREQIYNSTVTQMSACLLSLSVISLVLPTAFHASFSDTKLADAQSLKISRGTSVILLLVYIIYLLFQLMSHAYMYESTPQHIIDEESTPGPAAGWLDSSSSDSSSSDDSDSSDSDRSRETVSKRVRRVMRGNRRRKSSVVSVDTSEGFAPGGPTRTPSFGTTDVSAMFDELPSEESSARPRAFPKLSSGVLEGNEEAVEDEKPHRHSRRRHKRTLRKYRKHKHHKTRHGGSQEFVGQQTIDENAEVQARAVPLAGEPRRVDFAAIPHRDELIRGDGMSDISPARRPFTGLRGMSFRPVAKSLAPAVFMQPPDTVMPPVPSGPVPRVRYGIRRTNSLPDRLNQYYRAPGAMMPSQIPLAAAVDGSLAGKAEEHPDQLSRTSAILLLLISTGLVAVCAEFMVASINGLVATSSIGEIFIGLIIIPIVGNAAEHVTAITVAMKNKMDLAIGVAVGSSIQIALFITPIIVIIGWAMGRDMTLYFTLFETVCLFVSAFIVNFLVLDGRSNYLEGALLMATYIIIALVAFFYPTDDQTSSWGA